MRISELKNAPSWLIEAKTSNEDVEIVNGAVIWKSGVWHSGEWYGGVWHSGEWYGGAWHRGEWRGGEWCSGAWRGGAWHSGIWCGGTWHGGEWRGGFKKIGFCKWSVYYSADKVRIGCKVETYDYWDLFFSNDSTKVFDTTRNTDAFELIKKSYLMAKFANSLEK